MCGEFGEVSGIIDLVINFLAGGTLFFNSYDTLSYISEIYSGELFATKKKQLFLDNELVTLRCQAVPLGHYSGKVGKQWELLLVSLPAGYSQNASKILTWLP